MADNLPESASVTKTLLQTALQSKEGRDDIMVKDFVVSAGCKKGDNYSSVILSVKVTTQDDGEENDHHLIIKTPWINEYRKKYVLEVTNQFYKEAMAYKELIPDMIQHQRQKGVNSFVPSVPKYYHSFVDNNSGILVLGDLRKEGYTMIDKKIGVDYEQCKLVMKELAIFHALSWTMKDRNPENLKKYDYVFRDSIMINSKVPSMLPKLLKTSVYLVKSHSRDVEICKHVDNLMALDMNDTLIELLKPKEPYAVICHGDPWSNNLLFKHSNTPAHIVSEQVKLVDLAVLRYAPPTTDLTYFMYTSTTKIVRKAHTQDLLRLYHSTFLECLDQLGFSFTELTFDVLEQQYTETALYGILFACVILPTILASAENAPEFEKMKAPEDGDKCLDEFQSRLSQSNDINTVIKNRLVELVQDAIELKLI